MQSRSMTTLCAIRRGAFAASVSAAMAGCDPVGARDPARWIAIDASTAFTCALTPAGYAACWGAAYWDFPDFQPDPPDAVMPNSATPILVPDGGPFVSLVVSGADVCALDVIGAARCWGANVLGTVGDGTFTARRTPVDLAGGRQWRQLSSGLTHMCGVTTDQKAYCWGNNFSGTLGAGAFGGASTIPVEVAGQHTFDGISAGTVSTCALTPDGHAFCWGQNGSGELGTGSTASSPFPVAVAGDLMFTSITVGGSFACGLASDAKAYCWGWNNSGRLGKGDTTVSTVPVPVLGELAWAQLSAGGAHACGIAVGGDTYCWGLNNLGQLGDSTFDSAFQPKRVAASVALVRVESGSRSTCAIDNDGVAYCWGKGNPVPTRVEPPVARPQ